MQTILGANGVIAKELSSHLPRYTTGIRQVSRKPRKVNPADELVAADLLQYDETEKAVAGSEVVYLVAGLKYDTKVWREQWPRLMRNVIDACKKHESKLVFFDNVYAYGLVDGVMTEDTPFNPTSRKGEVRARTASMLLEEVQAGNLQGMIVRAADFYGPAAVSSLTHTTVTERLKTKKTPRWMGDPKAVHTFTYTPDAGSTVAVLGNTPSAFNQTWHALTSKERMTGELYVKIACDVMGQSYRIQNLSRFSVRLLGLFVPILGEFLEMMYQLENDYVFDSTKFEAAFHLQPTAYKEGIEKTLQ